MVSHMNGDLLVAQQELNLDVICHQVNCQGVMGSGIAKQIRDTYPIVFENYKKKCDTLAKAGSREQLLGMIQIVALYEDYHKDIKHPCVCNFFSQYNYGYDGRRYTSYDAFWNCLNELRRTIPVGSSIGFPARIGCDRGGANWAIIEKMIEEVLGADYFVYIVHFDGGK